MMVDYYWTTFYRKGGRRIEDALKQLGRMSNQDDYVAWAQIVLLMDIEEQEKAEEILREMKGKSQGSPSHFDILPRFFMPGEFEDKVKYASMLAQRAAKTGNGFQYMAGGITEDELKGLADESKSEREKLGIYFAMGIRQLAEGRRSAAKENFQRCADSPYYGWSAKLWARAFVDRLDKGDDWPKWLPAKDAPVEKK